MHGHRNVKFSALTFDTPSAPRQLSNNGYDDDDSGNDTGKQTPWP